MKHTHTQKEKKKQIKKKITKTNHWSSKFLFSIPVNADHLNLFVFPFLFSAFYIAGRI